MAPHAKLLRTARDGEGRHEKRFMGPRSQPKPGCSQLASYAPSRDPTHSLPANNPHCPSYRGTICTPCWSLGDWGPESPQADLLTGDNYQERRKELKALGGPHSILVSQPSPPTCGSFLATLQGGRKPGASLLLSQVNRQGIAWAGPRKDMGSG